MREERVGIEQRLSACLEWIFADSVALEDRVEAAASNGLSQIEFWSWRERNVDRLAEVLHSAHVGVSSVDVDPGANIGDRGTHRAWLNSVNDSAKVAARLHSPVLCANVGLRLPDPPAHDQIKAMIGALSAAATIAGDNGVKLALEPVSDRDGHPPELLTSSLFALKVVDEVDSPSLGILLDVYHSHAKGEDVPETIRRLRSRIIHVQVADNPGRHEPGTGRISWDAICSALDEIGYEGAIGLEYKPTLPSAESVSFSARVLRKAHDSHYPKSAR